MARLFRMGLALLLLALLLPGARPATAADRGDGGWDTRFGPPGIYEGDVEAAALAPNGDLYVAGAFGHEQPGAIVGHVARWDGLRWHALGAGVSGDLERVRDLAVHGANVYVVGSFTSAGDVVARGVARWDGAAWHALGTGAGPHMQDEYGTSDGTIYAVAAAANGDVYVAGNFNQIDDVSANGVARWDGAQWHALGAGLADRGVVGGSELFPAWVYALAVGPDGNLYAGGQFSDAAGELARNIARWDGAQWHALGEGVTGGGSFNLGQVDAIAVDGANVYVGGTFTSAGGSPAANIARWDGAQWRPLGAGLTSPLDSPSPVLALLARPDGLYAGGTFTSAGGRSISGLARWDGAQWQAYGAPLSDLFGVKLRVLASSAEGGLFAGGTLGQAGGSEVFGIAHWNGERWESMGQGVALYADISALVDAVAVDDAGRVYIGGLISTAGGVLVGNVAMWDGLRWHDMGGGVGGGDETVSAILAVGDDVYVAGRFTQAGGISASRIARWNRATGTWHTLGAGMDGPVMALAYGDGVLYAAGSFTQAGGARALDVAAWDGASWSGLGGDWEVFEVLDSGNEAGTFAQALAYHNGELYIGGHFQTVHRKGAGSQDQSSYWYVHNVIGYTPGSGEWFSLGPDGANGVTTNGFSGFGTSVYSLAAVGSGLYIGGMFNRGGGLLTPNLARWDLRSGAWSSPGAPSGTSAVNVNALAGSGSTLLVGGSFTSIYDALARSVAIYNTADGTWDTLGGGMGWNNGQARVTAAALTGDTAYLGGQINTAGPNPSLGFAMYHGNFGGGPPPEYTNHVYIPLSVR